MNKQDKSSAETQEWKQVSNILIPPWLSSEFMPAPDGPKPPPPPMPPIPYGVAVEVVDDVVLPVVVEDVLPVEDVVPVEDVPPALLLIDFPKTNTIIQFII